MVGRSADAMGDSGLDIVFGTARLGSIWIGNRPKSLEAKDSGAQADGAEVAVQY